MCNETGAYSEQFTPLMRTLALVDDFLEKGNVFANNRVCEAPVWRRILTETASEKSLERDNLNNCKKEKIQEEASQAEEIQSMSLETFKQSQEKSQDGQPKPTPVPIVAACSGTCANEKI